MNISNEVLEKANRVQLLIEQKVLAQKGVQGTSISTVPTNRGQVCIKVIVDDKQLTTASLGINDNYDDIPVIISHEENKPL